MGGAVKQLVKGARASLAGPIFLAEEALGKVGIKQPKIISKITTLGAKKEDVPGLGNLLFSPKNPEGPDVASIAARPPSLSPTPASRQPGSTERFADDTGPTATQRSRRAAQRSRQRRRGTETVLTGTIGAPQSSSNVFKTILGG